MPIKQYQGVTPNSAANSLPTPFWCPEFRCRTVRRNGTQDLAIARLFGDGGVISGCRMRIFPCRQRKIEDSMGVARRPMSRAAEALGPRDAVDRVARIGLSTALGVGAPA